MELRAGAVGSALALALVMRGAAAVVLVDRTRISDFFVQMIQGRKIRNDSFVGDGRIVEREGPDEKTCASAECAEANSAKPITALRIDPLRIAAPPRRAT